MNGTQESKRLGCAPSVIVHIGTETERNDYYVYIWLDPRKPGIYKYGKCRFTHEPIYVGKTNPKGRREFMFIRDNKNPILKNKMNKVIRPIIIIYKQNLIEKEAFDWECKLIKRIGRINLRTGPLCNCTNGGEGSSGYIPTEETRKKISEINKGKKLNNHVGPLSEEHKLKLSKALKGRPSTRKNFHHSEEAKRKLSLAHKGRKRSEETRKKMSEAAKKRDLSYFIGNRKGVHYSDEIRRKNSEGHKGQVSAMKGKHHSEETRKKISEMQKGRIVSEETRRKISEWHKRKRLEKEQARRIELGIPPDIFESDVKHPEIGEYYDPEGWK